MLRGGGGDVEVTLDEGVVTGGSTSAPVSELEMELKKGTLPA